MLAEALCTSERFADRFAIQDCLNLNVIATDLLDAEAWKSTYWPDADEDHGWYLGNAHKFIDETVPSLQDTMDMCWHILGNTVIAFSDDTARVITYFYAYCRLVGEGEDRSDSFSGGRYVDRFEKRSGVWKIRHRITKPDWVRAEPNSFAWGSEAIPGFAPNVGNRSPDDPGRLLLQKALNVASQHEKAC